MDFLQPSLILPSHRPKQLTGAKNILVLNLLKSCALLGATTGELEQELRWMPNTVSPRLSELRSMGYVRKTEAQRGGQYIWLAVMEYST
jgi:DNA-binding IclR family transcriptional regulator